MLRGAGTGAVQVLLPARVRLTGIRQTGHWRDYRPGCRWRYRWALPIVARGAEKVYDAGKSFLQDLIQPKINLAPAAVQGADAVQTAVAPTQPITVGASDRSSALITSPRAWSGTR